MYSETIKGEAKNNCGLLKCSVLVFHLEQLIKTYKASSVASSISAKAQIGYMTTDHKYCDHA
jgi:hypothetical protein